MTETALMDMGAHEEFLELLVSGIGVHMAGYQVGWSPRKTKQMMADTDFAELIEAALDRKYDSIEKALHDQAVKGNMAAIQMVLYNRRPGQWKDLRRIEVKTDVTVNLGEVGAAKQAILEMIRTQGAAAMLPAPNGEILDVESEEVTPDADSG